MTSAEMRQRIAAFRDEIRTLTGRIGSMADSRLSMTLGPLWPGQGAIPAEPAWGLPAERRFFMKLQNECKYKNLLFHALNNLCPLPA
ncbi:MAG: hypothetical protein HGA59_06370 [Chlorobiaceae bacterium]|nr:hypothetical protein [Chlorobiaceae bacterium]